LFKRIPVGIFGGFGKKTYTKSIVVGEHIRKIVAKKVPKEHKPAAVAKMGSGGEKKKPGKTKNIQWTLVQPFGQTRRGVKKRLAKSSHGKSSIGKGQGAKRQGLGAALNKTYLGGTNGKKQAPCRGVAESARKKFWGGWKKNNWVRQ